MDAEPAGIAKGKRMIRRTTMIKWRTVLIGISIAFSPVLALTQETEEWVFKGNYVDACSCDLTCPCIFGGSPTRGFCKGATLVELTNAHYGGVDLSGVTVLAVYNGGEWIKFFVSENASSEQTDTVVKFLPIAEEFFAGPVREVRNVPISVTRTDERVKITADGTLVEIEQIRNAAGEPIKVVGLPAAGFPAPPYLNHTQYKTIALVHEGGNEDENYSFSGTNGFTAEIDTSSDLAAHSGESAIARIKSMMVSADTLRTGEYCELPGGTQTKHLGASLFRSSAQSAAAIGQ
jgi:hypothetical protein